jgi:hypothetical protein
MYWIGVFCGVSVALAIRLAVIVFRVVFHLPQIMAVNSAGQGDPTPVLSASTVEGGNAKH